MKWYGVCLSLSDLLHLVWSSLGPSTLLQMALLHSFYGWIVFHCISVQFSSVTQLCLTIAACQASLSITISWSSLKLMSIESRMASNHLILCCHFILLPSIFPNIRLFSNFSALRIRWPVLYWPKHSYSLWVSYWVIRNHLPKLYLKELSKNKRL